MGGVYLVEGKLGTGKGKFCVQKIRDAMLQGRKVATNMDLYLDKLTPSSCRATALRVPDKPTAEDLLAMGPGTTEADRFNEDRYGVLVLDELGSWLNSRQFQDKQRAGVLDWLIHARKHRWEVYLQVQSVNMIDKQVRDGMVEYLVKCIRADKIKIPMIGHFLGARGKLPRFHIANYRLNDVPGVVIDREFYRADDVQEGYDTLQIFSEANTGMYSYLPAWHLVGRHLAPQPPRTLLQRLFGCTPCPTPHPKPKNALVARLAKLPPDRAMHYARLIARGDLA